MLELFDSSDNYHTNKRIYKKTLHTFFNFRCLHADTYYEIASVQILNIKNDKEKVTNKGYLLTTDSV